MCKRSCPRFLNQELEALFVGTQAPRGMEEGIENLERCLLTSLKAQPLVPLLKSKFSKTNIFVMACRTAVPTCAAHKHCILDLPTPRNLPVTFSQLAKKQKANQLPAGTLNETHISKIQINEENSKGIVFLQIFPQSGRGHQ